MSKFNTPQKLENIYEMCIKNEVVGIVLSYFKILCFINRMDPDEMPHFVKSHPSLYCL